MEEVWKDVPGYEGLYRVSNTGKVFGIKRKNILAAAPNEKGYMYVVLYKNGKMKSQRVHKIVMLAFCGKSNGLEINHIDGDKKNNNLSNLEYCTHYENMHHAIRSGLSDKRKAVVAFDDFGNKVKEYDSIVEAEADNHIKGIGRAIKSKNRAAGFYWNYKKEITA